MKQIQETLNDVGKLWPRKTKIILCRKLINVLNYNKPSFERSKIINQYVICFLCSSECLTMFLDGKTISIYGDVVLSTNANNNTNRSTHNEEDLINITIAIILILQSNNNIKNTVWEYLTLTGPPKSKRNEWIYE